MCVKKRERERRYVYIMLLVGHNLIVTVHVYIYTLNCTHVASTVGQFLYSNPISFVSGLPFEHLLTLITNTSLSNG